MRRRPLGRPSTNLGSAPPCRKGFSRSGGDCQARRPFDMRSMPVGCFAACRGLTFVCAVAASQTDRCAATRISGLDGRAALFQCGAVASHTSNILSGSGAQFHRAETIRQAIYAETRRCPSFRTAFGNGRRSGPPAMRAAESNGPSVQRVHRSSVVAAHDRFVRRQRPIILCRCGPQSLCKIAHF
jgi:hypothetical protein